MSRTKLEAGVAASAATLVLAGVAVANGRPEERARPAPAPVERPAPARRPPAPAPAPVPARRAPAPVPARRAPAPPHGRSAAVAVPAPASAQGAPGPGSDSPPAQTPWRWDADNPRAPRFAEAVVDCLRERGVREVEAVPPARGDDRIGIALGGERNDPESIRLGLQLTSACEREASGH